MILERVVEQVRREYAAAGKSDRFSNLKQFLWTERDEVTYADLAQPLGMTEAALKMAATRLRQRCREVLRSEVAPTVANTEEVEDEVKCLLSVLRG